MPSHETARALIRAAGVPVAAPSANTSGRPSPTTAAHVWEDLNGKINCILDGGPVGIGLESTIIDVTGEVPVILRPGYISREMAEAVVGIVDIDRAVEGPPDPQAAPKAPGMKYRHYAPKAELTIVTGGQQDVIDQINRLTDEKEEAGIPCGVICTEESRDQYRCRISRQWAAGSGRRPSPIICMGFCVNLMRRIPLSFTLKASKKASWGQAIMNRLKKAAGYHIIQV